MNAVAKIKNRLRGGATLVALGILLSRVAGLIRERVFAHYLGNSVAAGAFKAALRIPNFLQNLFGEGVLSASFIPVYAKLLAQNNSELAGRLAGVVGSVLAVLVSLMVLIGVVLTPWFVDLVAPGFHGESRDLTIQIVQILFPGVGLLVISAWCLGILNSHRKFFISYVAPVLWNAAMILTLIIFGREQNQNDLAVTLAWGSVVGCLLQLGIQLPFVFKNAKEIRFGFETSLEPVQKVFKSFGPILISRGVVQISAYIDGIIASFLGTAAVSGIAYAQTIYLLPIGLFGMSIAAAQLPEMSSATATGSEGYDKLRAQIRGARKKISFFVIPSIVAFALLGRWVVAALYETGAFGSQDTLYVWYILLGSVIGLLAATWGRIYSSAFYVIGDAKTPLKFAIFRVIFATILGLLLAFTFRKEVTSILLSFGLATPELPDIHLSMGAVGLTFSSALAGWIEYELLKRSLTKRIGDSQLAVKPQVQIWTIAILSGVVSYFLATYVHEFLNFTGINYWHHSLEPIVNLGIFGVLYLGSAKAFSVKPN